MAVKTKKSQAQAQSEMLEALQHVSDEKGIPVETLVATIEGALVSSYKKAFGGVGAVRVEANFETNDFRVFAQKLVVQRALNPNTEIAWKDAQADNPGLNLGDSVETEVTPAGFGRIAAQTAKQVLLQKLKEAEREQVVSEYRDKEGQMFRGTVQRVEHGNVILAIGKAEAVLPRREQVGGETYRFGDQLFVYVTDVRQSFRGPSITVSRTHPGLVRQLFTLEVPEISDGIVELKNVSREAGQRTKIAVYAENPDVDPVGACVGPRGTRVGRVVDELGREKVDIVRWNEDPVAYISNALSPAQISKVILKEDPTPGPAIGTATVIVSEDQQSLAIGKQGQNVRLAARLTGWRIDIRTEKQYAEEQAARMFREEEETEDESKVTVVENLDATSKLFSVEDDAESEETASNAGSTPESETAESETAESETAESETAESDATAEADVTSEIQETENAAGEETKAE
jgi:N utilization substance protein A